MNTIYDQNPHASLFKKIAFANKLCSRKNKKKSDKLIKIFIGSIGDNLQYSNFRFNENPVFIQMSFRFCFFFLLLLFFICFHLSLSCFVKSGPVQVTPDRDTHTHFHRILICLPKDYPIFNKFSMLPIFE